MSDLSFQNTRFDVVDRSGQPWLKAADIARALGYAREDSVSRIYDRNAGEFTEAMSQTVNLTVSGKINGLQNITARIFSLRGAHLLAMFARTEVAKEFRRWVLDILDREITVPPAPTFPASLGRWILGFDGRGKPNLTHLDAEEAVINPNRLPEIINAPDSVFDDTRLLMRIAGACLGKLAPTAAAEADRDDITALRSFPEDVQADIEARAWRLTGQAHARIISYVAGSVALCAGHGQDVSKPAAQHRLEQITLEDALSLTAREMTALLGLADYIAKAAADYAEAVRNGMQVLRERGMVIGPVVDAGRVA